MQVPGFLKTGVKTLKNGVKAVTNEFTGQETPWEKEAGNLISLILVTREKDAKKAKAAEANNYYENLKKDYEPEAFKGFQKEFVKKFLKEQHKLAFWQFCENHPELFDFFKKEDLEDYFKHRTSNLSDPELKNHIIKSLKSRNPDEKKTLFENLILKSNPKLTANEKVDILLALNIEITNNYMDTIGKQHFPIETLSRTMEEYASKYQNAEKEKDLKKSLSLIKDFFSEIKDPDKQAMVLFNFIHITDERDEKDKRIEIAQTLINDNQEMLSKNVKDYFYGFFKLRLSTVLFEHGLTAKKPTWFQSILLSYSYQKERKEKNNLKIVPNNNLIQAQSSETLHVKGNYRADATKLNEKMKKKNNKYPNNPNDTTSPKNTS